MTAMGLGGIPSAPRNMRRLRGTAPGTRTGGLLEVPTSEETAEMCRTLTGLLCPREMQ